MQDWLSHTAGNRCTGCYRLWWPLCEATHHACRTCHTATRTSCCCRVGCASHKNESTEEQVGSGSSDVKRQCGGCSSTWESKACVEHVSVGAKTAWYGHQGRSRQAGSCRSLSPGYLSVWLCCVDAQHVCPLGHPHLQRKPTAIQTLPAGLQVGGPAATSRNHSSRRRTASSIAAR